MSSTPSLTSSVIRDIWTYAELLGELPGLFERVNAEPEIVDRPLSDKIISSAVLTFMSMTAAAASPIVLVVAAAASTGEKLWRSIDVLPEVAEKVQQFGDKLQEQGQLIECLQPILDLSQKVSLATGKIEQRAAQAEADMQSLEELRENYAAEAPKLDQVLTFTTRLEAILPQTLGKIEPGSLKEILLKENIQVVATLSEKEQKLRALKNRLQALMTKVQTQAIELQKCEEDIALLTRIKGRQIEGIDGYTAFLSHVSPLKVEHVILESRTVV